MYVHNHTTLTDSVPHRDRFNLAKERNKNIAFVAYANVDGFSLVGLETIGLDYPHTENKESGSHNYKTMKTALELVTVSSPVAWWFTKLAVGKKHPAWKDIGWPA